MLFINTDNRHFIIFEQVLLILSTLCYIDINQTIACYVCNQFNIPFDLTLSIASSGFGYDIVVLLLIFEILSLAFLVEVILSSLVLKILSKSL